MPGARLIVCVTLPVPLTPVGPMTTQPAPTQPPLRLYVPECGPVPLLTELPPADTQGANAPVSKPPFTTTLGAAPALAITVRAAVVASSIARACVLVICAKPQ